ncbi:conjugal transfer protein TraN [Orientia tsutsugamushi]|uniref:conjugal transfer protein TraN n=1 Tax=Orientia tsutsugamushi TaxID=784 RepID=UPI003528CDC0
MKQLIVLVLIILNINGCIASMQSSYNEASNYNVNLGNSSNTQELFHQGSNVNYPNNDEDLTYHGRNQLGTESGAMLFQAENSKNNALTQHNINDQNYMIANSMRIESDPLSALDSSNFVTQTSTTNTEIIQSCTEGSNFNIELNSTCQKSVANICLLWQHDYSCSTEKQTMLHSSLRNNSIFCLGGNCNTPTIIPNRDIAKVAHLAMLNQMSKDIKTNPVSVFSGKHRKCKKDVFSFLHCCSSMTGWGRDIGLSQCKSKEQKLALYRKKGYCYYIGTYCSSRVPILGICLARKSTYCCFQSKLARIFQEEARKQLKMNFGTPKCPKCRGLTVEELQKVDFTKINMDELFGDILTKAQNSMNKDIIAGIKDKVHRMQQSQSK